MLGDSSPSFTILHHPSPSFTILHHPSPSFIHMPFWDRPMEPRSRPPAPSPRRSRSGVTSRRPLLLMRSAARRRTPLDLSRGKATKMASCGSMDFHMVHGAGRLTSIYLHDWVIFGRKSLLVNISAPWSIWDWLKGKSQPETIDFHMIFPWNMELCCKCMWMFPWTNPLNSGKWWTMQSCGVCRWT